MGQILLNCRHEISQLMVAIFGNSIRRNANAHPAAKNPLVNRPQRQRPPSRNSHREALRNR